MNLWTFVLAIVSLSFAVFVCRFAVDPDNLGIVSPPDVIFWNATFWTGVQKRPVSQAMAVRGGRVVEVGGREFVQALAGKTTVKVDLGGAFVTPGFIDSHVHFISGGLQLGHMSLRDCKTKEDLISRVAKAVEEKKGTSEWIFGAGWSEDHWGGELPSKEWLDQVSPKNPVWLTRIDFHMGLANSAALNLAGISVDTEDPEGGSIVRDGANVPTGLLKDAAIALLEACVPPPSLSQRREALLRAASHGASQGVTSVTDFGEYAPGGSTEKSWFDFHDVYQWADSLGLLKIRVHAVTPLPSWKRTAAFISRHGKSVSQSLRLGIVKEFADGSLGSRTALFYEPYSDSPGNRGLVVVNETQLETDVLGATKAGLQVAVHAIGDRAVDTVIGVFEKTSALYQPRRDLRPRIEHMQHLASGAANRAAAIGAVASMQAQHLYDDVEYMEARIGKERLGGAYCLRSVIRNGSVLALGSDWTVAPLTPLEGMRAAVSRKLPEWKKAFNPKEKINPNEALLGYTKNAAYASFWEDDIGTLEIGKFADFVVLSGNLLQALEIGSEILPDIKRTYLGGHLNYENPKFASFEDS